MTRQRPSSWVFRLVAVAWLSVAWVPLSEPLGAAVIRVGVPGPGATERAHAAAASQGAEETRPDPQATARYRRGDPWGEQATRPQVVVALPPQVTGEDVRYWLWVTGQSDDIVVAAADALVETQTRNDALRARRLPEIFELAIAAGQPLPGLSTTRANSLAQSLRTLRTAFLRDDLASLSGLFLALSEATGGAVDAREWEALRQIDVGPLYPDSPSASRMDWGRTLFRLARSGAIAPASAETVATILRDAAPGMAAAQSQLARATSDLIAATVRFELLATARSQGGDVAEQDVDDALRTMRSAKRRFAVLANRDAEVNESLAETMADVLSDPDGAVILRNFGSLAYGALAAPALEASWVQPLAEALPVEEDRRRLLLLLAEWTESNAVRFGEARRIAKVFRRAQLEGVENDSRLWRRTADRLSALHTESERTLSPITSLVIAATPAASVGSVIGEVEYRMAQGSATFLEQLEDLSGRSTEELGQSAADRPSAEPVTPENAERIRRLTADPSTRPSGG